MFMESHFHKPEKMICVLELFFKGKEALAVFLQSLGASLLRTFHFMVVFLYTVSTISCFSLMKHAVQYQVSLRPEFFLPTHDGKFTEFQNPRSTQCVLIIGA